MVAPRAVSRAGSLVLLATFLSLVLGAFAGGELSSLTVAITGPAQAEVGTTVTLTSQIRPVTESAAPVTYRWRQTEGPSLNLAQSALSTNTVRFRPTEAGSYKFLLAVTAGTASGTATKVVEVRARPSSSPTTPPARAGGTTLVVSIITPDTTSPYVNRPFRLAAKPQGGPSSAYTYAWQQAEGDAVTPMTGWAGQTLVLPAGAMVAGKAYKFRVTVASGAEKSTAELTVVPQAPPTKP